MEQWQVGNYPVGNSENRNDPIFDDANDALTHAQKLTEGDEFAMIGVWHISAHGDASLEYLVCIDGVFSAA
jgi:hypothetical protein